MTLSPEDMDLIFRNARSQNGWLPEPVSDEQLRQLYELLPKLFSHNQNARAIFAGTGIKTNFLCNLGYGDASKVMPRSPRPAFDEICNLL